MKIREVGKEAFWFTLIEEEGAKATTAAGADATKASTILEICILFGLDVWRDVEVMVR
jgi:hypothetical protein